MASDETETRPKRQCIVEAAAAVFAGGGFTNTRVADIADRAGIGKGTVYEYFASKEELLFAVFEWIDSTVSKRLHEVLEEDLSARDKLLRLLRVGADVVTEQVELQPILLDFWAAARGHLFEERHREVCTVSYCSYRSLITAFIREGQENHDFRPNVDAEAIAAIVVSTFDGLGVQLFFDRSLDPHRITEAFGQMLIEALTGEAP
jgi:AcrR family transcriptional regulator